MMSLYTSQSCNNYIKNTKQNYINQNLMELKREIENWTIYTWRFKNSHSLQLTEQLDRKLARLYKNYKTLSIKLT